MEHSSVLFSGRLSKVICILGPYDCKIFFRSLLSIYFIVSLNVAFEENVLIVNMIQFIMSLEDVSRFIYLISRTDIHCNLIVSL
jgi:hypothetical protein